MRDDAVKLGLSLVELYGFTLTCKADVECMTALAVADGLLTPLEARLVCTYPAFIWGAR